MALRQAEVRFKDQRAGLLTETAAGGSRFIYDPDWDRNIACCLPVSRREHEWATGLHPFFQHLAPEGWLREQQARSGHVVEEDDLGLLLLYGADCIGAVSILPADGKLPDIKVTEATASPGRTVSGVQRKLLVTKQQGKELFIPAEATGSAPFIAKFNSDRIDSLVRNEALSLRWAAAVLGEQEVTAFQVSHIPALDETALVVTRFDRGPKGQKLRLEDCAQILCKSRGQDYGGKYNAGFEDVADVIKENSVRPDIDLLRFYRRLIAFTLVGNCDAHLKNFSLLERPEGLRLSPAYDVVNTAIYDGYDQTLALTFGGDQVQLEQADQALFRNFGARVGLPERAIDQTFVDLTRRVQRAASIIRPPEAEDPAGFRNRYKEIVDRTCLKILDM